MKQFSPISGTPSGGTPLIRGGVISALAAAGGYLGFSLWAGWREVFDALVAVGVSGMVAALALSLLNYGIRFVRWQAYLAALGHPMAAAPSAVIYISGFAFTTTPGKAGELLRGLFLGNHGIPIIRATAAFLSERLSDLLAVMLLSLPGLALLPGGLPIVGAGLGVVVLIVVALGMGDHLNLLASRIDAQNVGIFSRAMRKLAFLLHEARRCHSLHLILVATILSALAWSSEALAFYMVLVLLGFDPGIWYAISVYALSMLAGAISFLPGGLGGAEAVMVGLLTLRGAPEPLAVAATIVIRMATLWFAVALGLITVLIFEKHLKPAERRVEA